MLKVIFLLGLLATMGLNANTKNFVPKNFSMKFKQVHKSSLTGKDRTALGSLNYSYPGKIRLQTKIPDDMTLVANGKTTWHYVPPFMEGESGHLTIQRGKSNTLSAFFDLIKKGLVSNSQYTVKKKNNMYEIQFNKESLEKIGIKKTDLYFKKTTNFSDLGELVITYSDNKLTKFIFTKIDTDVKFSDKEFVFQQPKNTKVIKN